MAQVLMHEADVEGIERAVCAFDPATHPGFAPMLDKLSSEDLEVVRAYVAHEIRSGLGIELLARAMTGTAIDAGWAQLGDELTHDARRGTDLDMPFNSICRKYSDDELSDAVYELIRAAKAPVSAAL